MVVQVLIGLYVGDMSGYCEMRLMIKRLKNNYCLTLIFLGQLLRLSDLLTEIR